MVNDERVGELAEVCDVFVPGFGREEAAVGRRVVDFDVVDKPQ